MGKKQWETFKEKNPKDFMKKLKKYQTTCTHLDDMHFFVNEVYTKWDEGEIKYEKAKRLMLEYCNEFVEYNTKEKENGKQLGKKN